MLLEVEEMEELFNSLEPFSIYLTASVTNAGEEKLSKQAFLKNYADYLSLIKQGKPLNDPDLRCALSSSFTIEETSVFTQALEENRQLVRVKSPVIQLQLHQMNYSDGKFRSMVLGNDCIAWGLQFSFPGLYEDPETKEALPTTGLANSSLFRKLQKWARGNTLPTPFLVEGKKINVPVRLGKKCTSWINTHPDLQRKNIKVAP